MVNKINSDIALWRMLRNHKIMVIIVEKSRHDERMNKFIVGQFTHQRTCGGGGSVGKCSRTS